MRSLDIAATGMLAQQLNVDVIANNIANLSTTAYKRQVAEFHDLLYQSQLRVGSSSSSDGTIVPTGTQVGLGVKTAGIYRVNLQGAIRETGNTFDLAINGPGYFQVNLADGEAYTRAGAFQVNQDGELVTSEGFQVSPGITVPQGAVDVTINQNGEVLVKLDGQTELSNVGQIDLVTFINESGLEADGENLFLETEASGAPIAGFAGDDGFGSLLQRFLEVSNVDQVKELTELITAQRAYELNSRVISTADEMLSALSNLR